MIKDGAYNIICFGFLPWSNMWKRNQSMMAEMAKCDSVNSVIFVNPLVSIRSFINHTNNKENTTVNYYHKLMPSAVTSKLVVYTPVNILPCKEYLAPFKRAGIGIMLKVIRRLNAGKPYILFMNCPNIFSRDLLDQLLENAELSLFDFSDDFVEFGLNRETIDHFECNINKYAKAANIVLTVNDHIKNKYSHLNSNIHVLRNATSYDNFDRKDYKRIEVLEKIKDRKKPVIGYSGLANMSRIDADLLDFLMDEKKEWQFVFVGPAKSNFLERYSSRSNFHFIPPVDYETLPDYIHYFDAAIVPFKINEHTRGNDLLKLHDYLAMGKPVVSTEIGGANDLKEVIRTASKREDFLEALEKALLDKKPEDFVKRKSVAFANSWHARVKKIDKLIKDGLGVRSNCRNDRKSMKSTAHETKIRTTKCS